VGKGQLNKEQLAKREQFDAEVRHLMDDGLTKEEVAIILGCSGNKVQFAIRRNTIGYSMTRIKGSAEREAQEEAELLINAKMAPVVKPKAKLVEVNGWENGKYVHYTAWDVSEYWGL